MKIQILKSGTKKNTSISTCPFYLDEPPASKK
jgi:hypothetical protein